MEEEANTQVVAPVEGQAQQPAGDVTEVAPEGEPLLAGKFKTAEDLEKSYLELQSAFTKKAQEASQQVPDEDLLPKQDTPSGDVNAELESFNRMVDQRVTQVTGPWIAKLEIAEAKAKNPDFDQLKPQILKVYEEFPELRKPGNLDRAIRLAKAEMIGSIESSAKAEGRREAMAKVEEGKKTKTESASTGGERSSKSSLSPEAIANMGSQELRELISK